MTPESIHRAIWLPSMEDDPKQDKLTSCHGSVQTPQDRGFNHHCGFGYPSMLIDDGSTSFLPGNTASRKGSMDKLNSYLDPPLLNLLPRLPPLQVSSQNRLDSRMPDVSDIDAESPPAPPSPHSPTVSIPSSFAIPSPLIDRSQDYDEKEDTEVSSPAALVHNLFPAPAIVSSSNGHRSLATLSSVSIESRALSTDSPILPAELNEKFVASQNTRLHPRLHHFAQPFTPTSADLDAFAHAAEAAALASESSLVLTSGTDRPALHIYECPSLENLTPTGGTSSSDGQYDGDEDGSFDDGYDELGSSTNSSARRTKTRHGSVPLPSRALQRSVSSHVEVGVQYFSGHDQRKAKSKFSAFRKLGGKIKSLFKSEKTEELGMPTEGFQVKAVTRTTVTNVEYASVSADFL